MIDGRWCDIKVPIQYSAVSVADPNPGWGKNPDPNPSGIKKI
jgi:hypothetical protein